MFQKPGATHASSSVRLVLAIVGTSAMFACSDATAPEKLQVAPSPTQAIASRPATIVSPEDMHGWTFVHDGTGKPCAGAECRMVAGPGHPPFGSGSAELSATNGSETSLSLKAFQGTRLDQVTALRYTTYRASHDAGASLAVALVLNVKFDLGATSNGDVGQLVFDPARTPGANVPDSVWQHWEARAGMWWATRQAGHVGEGADAHPCVESHPCTWSEMLERYPNIGIASDGGVLLSARRGAEFTGNVDSLVVGVAGVNAVFDFELVARRNQYVLKSEIQDGAIVGQFTSDTLFDEGTAVTYAFTSRAGRAEPLLVLDDTLLLPTSGQIVMDGAHSLKVVSDTVYSYETLTPMETRIADLTRALLASSDKLSAVKALNAYYLDQVNAGVDPAEVARAEKVAQFVVVDPVRDAAAMDAVDAALTGLTVHYQLSWDHIFSYITRDGAAPGTGSVPAGPPGASSSVPPSGEGLRASSLSPSPEASRDLAVVPNAENPHEYTRILYMNGIRTFRNESWSSTLILAKAIFSKPRFANNYTRVTMYYNPTQSVQMQSYDATHRCDQVFQVASAMYSMEKALLAYATCRAIRFATAVKSVDLVESITARVQLEGQWVPTNDEAIGFANVVATYRAQNWHVLVVGHSEGTILEAQAIRMLPALEGHPIEVANRCVAVLALAPATRRDTYGMDEYHLKGLLAEHDIIRVTFPSGWQTVYTDLTRSADSALAAATPANYVRIERVYGQLIHSVNSTYFGPLVMPIVIERLSEEHKECVAGSADLTPSAQTVSLGDLFTATLVIRNQNDRQLLGRTVEMSDDYAIARTDSMTFRAMVPADQAWNLRATISPDLTAIAAVMIPPIDAAYQFTEEQHSQWDVIGESNASLPDGTTWSDVGPAPTTSWDGTVAGCTDQKVRKYGWAGNWREWQLHCNRVYRPVFTRPDSLPTGRLMSYSLVHWTTPAGEADSARFTSRTPGGWYYYCPGAVPCLASSYLEHVGPASVVARSAVLTPTVVGTAASPIAVRSATPSNSHARGGSMMRAWARGILEK